MKDENNKNMKKVKNILSDETSKDNNEFDILFLVDATASMSPYIIAAKEETKTYSLEEVRRILADKSRAGYRAEVKALLTAHGASRLSDITDPAALSALALEAEVIGNG